MCSKRTPKPRPSFNVGLTWSRQPPDRKNSMSDQAKLYPPPAALVGQAHISGRAAYDALLEESRQDHEAYWARLAREFLEWKRPFTKVLDSDNAPFFKWFEDGTLNASYNCLDRQVHAGLGSKTAIVFEA